jgi:site-specific DNA recombinase
LKIPWTAQSKTRKREIITPANAAKKSQPILNDERLRLLRSIAEARTWIDDLIDGSVADTAALVVREGPSERSIRVALSLAFLDPQLVKAAAEGRLPRGYGCSRLTDLPMAFGDQWRALGLTLPG